MTIWDLFPLASYSLKSFPDMNLTSYQPQPLGLTWTVRLILQRRNAKFTQSRDWLGALYEFSGLQDSRVVV